MHTYYKKHFQLKVVVLLKKKIAQHLEKVWCSAYQTKNKHFNLGSGVNVGPTLYSFGFFYTFIIFSWPYGYFQVL